MNHGFITVIMVSFYELKRDASIEETSEKAKKWNSTREKKKEVRSKEIEVKTVCTRALHDFGQVSVNFGKYYAKLRVAKKVQWKWEILGKF